MGSFFSCLKCFDFIWVIWLGCGFECSAYDENLFHTSDSRRYSQCTVSEELTLLLDYSKFGLRAQVRLQFLCILDDGISMEYKKVYGTCISSEIISALL
jgi:hypothetical protein